MKTKIWLSSVLLLLSGLAQANDPVPLKILVGFGAGGSADLAARLLAERLKDELGRPVVVENRVGAGGRIAAEALKNAAPNGATVMLAPIVVPVLAPLVYKKLNYDAQKDLAPAQKCAQTSHEGGAESGCGRHAASAGSSAAMRRNASATRS